MTSPIDSGWWGSGAPTEHLTSAPDSPEPLMREDGGGGDGRILWEQELRQKERELADWAAWLQDQTPFTPAWALPAKPVTEALRGLYRDRYIGGGDIATFAAGFDLNPSTTRQLLEGDLGEVTVEEIAELCEGLKCTPYDLWEPDVARTILHAYGPERWPSYTEPLHGPGEPSIVRHLDHEPAADQARDSADLSVTCYREAGVLQVDDFGTIAKVRDNSAPAVEGAEYHLAFQQIEAPRLITVTRADAALNGPPAGADADPALVAIAKRLRLEPELTGTAMVRFTSTATINEQWLGFDPSSGTWQTWDDPRDYFPGEPADVLAGVSTDEPLPFELPADRFGDIESGFGELTD